MSISVNLEKKRLRILTGDAPQQATPLESLLDMRKEYQLTIVLHAIG